MITGSDSLKICACAARGRCEGMECFESYIYQLDSVSKSCDARDSESVTSER